MNKCNYLSPLGWFEMESDNDAITKLILCETPDIIKIPENPVLRQCCLELDEYFAGKREKFDIKTSFTGTPFQNRVWQELEKIPYGKTISYADLAKAVENPKACRAVGSANGKNPIAIIIPCHRVIASDGGMGGYAYGLDVKKQLLGLEKGS
ncbi:MAG: methylated-DNA--[protein]-cysteine S-methyltransferase [Dysgonamonadaceae bacterium]|jgi:methylated-DNA-[protein]-cysteine S-methyltransferase|nr:methylated-DNA--[protein]-cysteine S-methyltransferase [Dysgonamonadaceae bacterium]